MKDKDIFKAGKGLLQFRELWEQGRRAQGLDHGRGFVYWMFSFTHVWYALKGRCGDVPRGVFDGSWELVKNAQVLSGEMIWLLLSGLGKNIFEF